MEGENNTTKAPQLCTAGCGFYGNEIYNNMCSKCFKEKNKKSAPANDTSTESKLVLDDNKSNTAVKDQDTIVSSSPALTSSPQSNVIPSPSANDNSEANTPTSSDKPIQPNKGKCFKCRIKVPLAKQTINKCKCEYVFCDRHRQPEDHECEVDYAKIGRDLLARNNPRLHERPKGGRSFKRIDSL
ncbi:unnamed protein product [Cunninghamella blakesleeana]